MSQAGFIDIHSHILPRLDEGPSCLTESLKMLRVAQQDGISGIVATPQVLDGVYDNTKERINEALARVGAANTGVQLHMGAEIRIGRKLALRLGNNELPLLNDG